MMMMSPTMMMMITMAEKWTNPQRRGESSRKTEISSFYDSLTEVLIENNVNEAS